MDLYIQHNNVGLSPDLAPNIQLTLQVKEPVPTEPWEYLESLQELISWICIIVAWREIQLAISTHRNEVCTITTSKAA